MNIHTYLTALEMVPEALRAARALGLDANRAANQYIIAATGVDVLAAMQAPAARKEVARIPAPPRPPKPPAPQSPPAQELQPEGWDSAQVGDPCAVAAEPLPPSLGRQTLHAPGQLGQQLGGMPAARVNELLNAAGLQENKSGFWAPTSEGEKFARWRPGKEHGNQTMELHWSAAVLDILRAKMPSPQNPPTSLPATDVRLCRLDDQACEACQ